MMQIRSAIRLALLAALLASAGPAHSQDDGPPKSPPERRGGPVELLGGVRIGWPQQVAAYGGVALVQKRYEGGYTGTSVLVEPGLGGGAVRVGWTSTGGIGMLARAQLSVIRTWGDPWVVGPDQTWIGADVQGGFGFISIAAGGYVRAPTDGANPTPMLTLNLVFGN